MIRQLAHKLVGTPLFVNPIYRNLYYRRVRSKVKGITKPRSLMIEMTSRCNMACLFCFRSKLTRPSGIIDDGLYKKIIFQAVNWGIDNINLQGFGEPLLDPNLTEKIAYAKKAGIKEVTCVTNGSLLNLGMAESLITAGLDALGISIDAATSETYKKIHGGGNEAFYNLICNLRGIDLYKTKYNSLIPRISMFFRKNSINNKEEKSFINQFKKYGDTVVLQQLFKWVGTDVIGNVPQKNRVQFPCYFLWDSIIINWDGQVVACCQDFNAKFPIGDIKSQTLREVWDSPKLNLIRDKHLAGVFTGLCKACDMNTQYVSPWWF